MSEMHRIRVEVDDHCYTGMVIEARRLGIDTEEIARRAIGAWLIEVGENAPVEDRHVAVAADRPATTVVEEHVATTAVG